MQVRGVTSEPLETKIRQLLPSQAGFTEELSAQNQIVPIIDLTAAAEGSSVPESMQQAIAFGSQTAFSQVGAGTTVIVNSPGFWRIVGTANNDTANANHTVNLELTDGVTTKIVWQTGNMNTVNVGTSYSVNIDLIFFLASGESLQATCSTNLYIAISGSSRQVATGDGTLVNPSGFPL